MSAAESREGIIEYFKKHNNCNLPYCIEAAADRQGAHVMVVGGTHGNEPAGVSAMIAFHRRLKDGEINLNGGKVSLLLGNPQAYEQNQRYLERDLNRGFNEPDNTTLEGRRAGEILTYLDQNRQISALLDLHSVSIGDFKICVYEKNNTQSLNLALGISEIPLHFAYYPEHMPGALITAAAQRRACGLIVECGNHQSKQGSVTALNHTQALLAHYGLMNAAAGLTEKKTAPIIQYESIDAIKPGSHFQFLIKDVQTGTKLTKGQAFAKDDDRVHIARQDCYIVAPSRKVKPTDDDAGFLCRLNQMRFSSTPWHAT